MKKKNIWHYKGGSGVGTSVRGVGVLTCGPSLLTQAVKRAATKHGLGCHSEVFDF